MKLNTFECTFKITILRLGDDHIIDTNTVVGLSDAFCTSDEHSVDYLQTNTCILTECFNYFIILVLRSNIL